MFQIKMYKELAALSFPELNYQVCESVDYSISAMYSTGGQDFSMIDPYGKLATGIEFDSAPMNMTEF